ncbi:MAG: hypothetical protein ACT4QE_23660, partial [Anaerolineales bacterium]
VEANLDWTRAEAGYADALRHTTGKPVNGRPAPVNEEPNELWPEHKPEDVGSRRPAWVSAIFPLLVFISSTVVFFSMAFREAWGVGLGAVLALAALTIYAAFGRVKRYG